MGGGNVSCDFGGGGGTYHRVRPPKPVLEASESGICLVCAGFQQGENKRGGGKRIIGRGSKNRFWEGVLWYVFPSPEFSPPLFFSEVGFEGWGFKIGQI